jgi:hypothetical protein
VPDGSKVSGIASTTSPLKEQNKELKIAVGLVDKLLAGSTKYREIFSKGGPGFGGFGGGSSGTGMPQMSTGLSRSMGVAASVMAVGSVAYNALPDVADAVSQQMAVQQVASFSGRGITAASVLTRANAANKGGFTSAQGMSEAAANFMGGGYSFGSNTVQGNLKHIGGMSVVSGLANEQVAGGIASINSMNFLRMGIVARNADGSLKPINQIASSLYSRMYAGRNPTETQAAAVFRTNSAAYQNIARASGGDPAMIRMMQSAIVMQAKNGGRPLDTTDTNKMMDLQGWGKNSAERKQFALSSAEAGQLGATSAAQTSGYAGALDAAAKLTTGFTKLYKAMEPVSTGFANLQGFAGTFGNANNVTGSIANVGSTAVNAIGNYAMYKTIAKAAGKGTEAAADAAAAGGGVMSRLGSFALGAGKVASRALGVVGGALTLADTAKVGYQDKAWSWAHALQAAGSTGAAGAALGLVGGPSAFLTGGIGAALGFGSYAASHMFGSGGGAPDGQGGGTPGGGMGGVNNNTITTQYGVKGKMWASGHHTGVDFRAKTGDQVRAFAGGKISSRSPGKAYGNAVLIDHDDHTQGLYAHLSAKDVRPGQRVEPGQPIGKAGSTGNSTGPHLHFELRRGANKPTNPTSWLSSVASKGKSFLGNLIGSVTSFAKNAWNSLTGNNSANNVSSRSLGGVSSNSFGMRSGMTGVGNVEGSLVADLLGSNASGELGSRISRRGSAASSEYTDGPARTSDVLQGNGGTKFLSKPDLLKTLARAGFRGDHLREAYAIALAESGGRPRAWNKHTETGDNSFGIFQINFLGMEKERTRKLRQKVAGFRGKESLFNPDISAKAAYYMSHHGDNWSDWSTFKSGKYKQYVPAQSVVASALGGVGGGTPDGHDSSGSIVVHAKFNITAQNSTTGEAMKIAKSVAASLEKEIRNARIGRS